MSRTIPRIPIVSALSLLLLATVVTLWYRSPRHADVLMFYTPAGKLMGLASDAHGLLLCTTEIPFGNEMGLSAQTISTSRDEFTAVHDLLFDPSNEKWHFLGFRTANGTLGTWTWQFNALIIPYWALAIPLAVLPLTGFRRTIVRRRRKRLGQCLACGYDLRQSPDRCPECGKPVSANSGAKVANGTEARLKVSPAGALSWLVLGFLATGGFSALSRGRHAAALAETDPPERAVLEQTIGPIDFPNTTPIRSVTAAAQASGIKVEFRGTEPPSSAEADPPSRLMRIRLDSALRAACKASAMTPGETFQLWVAGRVVHFGPGSQSPRFVRPYPVAQLLHDIQIDLDRTAREEKRRSTDGGSRADSNDDFISVSFGGVDSSEALMRLIADTVRTDDWSCNGGNLGGLWISGGRIWVMQTQEGHAAVRTFLAAMEAPAPAETDPSDEDVHANLDQIIPELKLESTLEQSIETLRGATHANIVVYWNDLETLGVKRDALIKLHLWNISLDHALGAVLSLAGADHGDYPAMREVQDGIIFVGSTERNRDTSSEARMYDIRDLIEKFCSERRLPSATTQPNNLTFEYVAQDIADFIEHTVAVYSWKDQGGNVGTVREIAGRLLITQTPTAHRQIVVLLRALRSGSGKEGTVVYRQPPNR